MDVFDLVAKLSLDQSEYESGLSNASSTASSFGKGLKTAMGVGAVAVGAVTTAVAGVTSAFGSGISSLAEYTDHIDKQSQKMNMSAEAYQEWSAVMEHSGTSIDTMQASMKTLANAVETGNDAFEQLGLSQEQLASMDNEEIFSATITALQNVDDETQRTYLAGQLLGRGATELGALLNTSAEDTQAMKDRVKELGGVMSDDAVKAGASFQDSLQDMTTAFTGLKNNMLADFLPSVTTVMDGLTEVFAGNSSEGIGMITEGVNSFIDNLSELIPEISEVGGGILTALIDALSNNLDSILSAGADVMGQLGTAIINNLPLIFETASQILGQIVEGIITALPELAESALQIIESLATGIGEALPELIPTIVEVILQITNTLIEHLPELIDAGLQIFLGLVEGLTQAIPLIIEALPTLIENIINALVTAIPLIMDAGIQLFMALVDALPLIIEALVEALPQIIQTIIDFFTGDGFVSIMEASIQMMMAIIEALPAIISALASAVPQIAQAVGSTLVSNAPQILSASVTTFKAILTGLQQIAQSVVSAISEMASNWISKITDTVSQWKQAGIDLISGLWEGFKSKISSVADGVAGFADDMKDKIKSKLGIASPSKVFAEIGGFMAEGLGVGWDKEIDDINDKIENDMNYDAQMNITPSISDIPTMNMAKTSLFSDEDLNKIVDGLSFRFTNITNIDGRAIKEETYDYFIDRATNEQRSVVVATGGYY